MKSQKKLKYFQTNDNENITIQNLRDAAKAVLKGKFIGLFQKAKEKSQINNFTHHLNNE